MIGVNMNTFEEPPIKVAGHDVIFLSPTVAKITIHCPWPTPHIGMAITQEQVTFVKRNTEWVIHYMQEQGMVDKTMGMNIIVEIEHANQ